LRREQGKAEKRAVVIAGAQSDASALSLDLFNWRHKFVLLSRFEPLYSLHKNFYVKFRLIGQTAKIERESIQTQDALSSLPNYYRIELPWFRMRIKQNLFYEIRRRSSSLARARPGLFFPVAVVSRRSKRLPIMILAGIDEVFVFGSDLDI
jgi:hypothetical protein